MQNENDKQFLLKQHIPEVSAEFADEYCKAVTRRSFSEHTNMQCCSRQDLSIFLLIEHHVPFRKQGIFFVLPCLLDTECCPFALPKQNNLRLTGCEDTLGE